MFLMMIISYHFVLAIVLLNFKDDVVVPLFSILYLPHSFFPPLSHCVLSPNFPVRSVCFLLRSLLFTVVGILLEAARL